MDRILEEQLIQTDILGETKEHWKLLKKNPKERVEDDKEGFT